jgi:hypothetical protein
VDPKSENLKFIRKEMLRTCSKIHVIIGLYGLLFVLKKIMKNSVLQNSLPRNLLKLIDVLEEISASVYKSGEITMTA